ncbi:10975_t:CDS:2 [Entrophospora sp. SA101]|nr:10975_t:CDS:2 [Entrophospora sp. SA101]
MTVMILITYGILQAIIYLIRREENRWIDGDTVSNNDVVLFIKDTPNAPHGKFLGISHTYASRACDQRMDTDTIDDLHCSMPFFSSVRNTNLTMKYGHGQKAEFWKFQNYKVIYLTSRFTASSSKLDCHLVLPIDERTDLILLFGAHYKEYPILNKMTQDFLSIQDTSVARGNCRSHLQEKAAPGRHDDKCLRAITDLTIGEDKEATNRDDTVPNNRPLHT